MNFKILKVKYPVLLPSLIIALVALVARIIYYLLEIKSPIFLYPIIDEAEFVHTAKLLLANNFTSPEHYWHPPLYSWLMAILMKAGLDLNGIVIFQLLMGIAGTLILYAALRKLNQSAAFITSIIWAVYPVELFTETRFLSENLYIFLSLCLLYQLIRFEVNFKKILVTTLFTGLLLITKSQFILFMLFFIVYLIIIQKKLAVNVMVYLGVSMLIPVIVSVQNTKKAEGNFIFVSSNGPTNLYIGNSADINKTLNIRPYEWQEKFYPKLYDEAGIRFTQRDTSEESIYPYKLSGFLVRKTVNENVNPLVPIKNIFLKTFGLLHSKETPRNYDLYVYKQFNPFLNAGIWKIPIYFPLALFFYAALIYIFVRRKMLFRTKPWFWLMVLFIVHLLPSVLFFNAFRYRLPAVPIIIFLAVLFYIENMKNIRLQLVNLFLIILFGTQLTSALLIQKIPEFETYNTIGKALMKLDKPEKAGFWFRKAQRYIPKDEMVNSYENYRGSAAAKEKAGDLQGAVDEMNKAVEKNPQLDDAYLYRASLLYKLSSFNEAINDYSRALQYNTGNKNTLMMALYGRSLTKARINDPQGALYDLDSVITLFPDYAEAFTNRGIVKAQLGNFKEAITDFDQSIKLNPTNEKPYFNKAGACGAVGDVQGALINLDKAIGLKPDYAQAFFMRGQIKIEISSKKEACADFKKANELGFPDAGKALNAYCK
jgi:tetratricopeptide (TPR) repeat protein